MVLTTKSGKICDELRTNSRVTVCEGLDLSSSSNAQTLSEKAQQHLAGPFGLIHSVGNFWEHKAIHQANLQEAKEAMSSHYVTLYAVLHSLLPIMARVGGGRVIALSCTSVQFDHPDMAAFTSAKAAVNTLIKCTANEWADRGISANAIALSTVATERVRRTKPLASEENYLTPEETSLLIQDILFASSRYISGNIIRPLKYSHTYYHQAYFARNPSQREPS
jgi:NAD(P)-dependent dehydrogenase (short-subunit alcohol dehydrogenase family)